MSRGTVLTVMLGLMLAGAAYGFTSSTRDAPWALTGVSHHGRVLRLVYQGGGCLHPDGRAVVEESSGHVSVTVKQTIDKPGAGEGCTLELRALPLDVSLTSAIAGRRVIGGPGFVNAPGSPTTVPNVKGLDRADASAALHHQGFRVRIDGPQHARVVVAQTPPADTPVHQRPLLVRLSVARRPSAPRGADF